MNSILYLHFKVFLRSSQTCLDAKLSNMLYTVSISLPGRVQVLARYWRTGNNSCWWGHFQSIQATQDREGTYKDCTPQWYVYISKCCMSDDQRWIIETGCHQGHRKTFEGSSFNGGWASVACCSFVLPLKNMLFVALLIVPWRTLLAWLVLWKYWVTYGC